MSVKSSAPVVALAHAVAGDSMPINVVCCFVEDASFGVMLVWLLSTGLLVVVLFVWGMDLFTCDGMNMVLVLVEDAAAECLLLLLLLLLSCCW